MREILFRGKPSTAELVLCRGGRRMSRYIDADKLYELIRTNDYRLATIGIKQAIDEIPTADVAEVKRGEWTKDDSDGCFCSFCGWYTDYDYDYVTNNGLGNDDFIYCSHCGARMDGGNDEWE